MAVTTTVGRGGCNTAWHAALAAATAAEPSSAAASAFRNGCRLPANRQRTLPFKRAHSCQQSHMVVPTLALHHPRNPLYCASGLKVA